MSGVIERERERGLARRWLLPRSWRWLFGWMVGGDVPEGVSGVNKRECVRE